MTFGRGLLLKSGRVAVLPLLVALNACQSSSPGEVLAVEPSNAPQASAASGSAGTEIIGQGKTRLTIVIGSGADVKDIRNGAALALKDLDDGSLSVELVPANGGANAVGEKALEAFVKGSVAIAYAGVAPSEGVGKSALQIALLPNGTSRPAGSLAFLPSSLDSVEAGIRHSIANGSKSVVVLVPNGQGGGLQAMVGRLSTVAPGEVIEYAAGESADSIASKVAGRQGSTFAFTASDQQVAAIASAIRAKVGPQGAVQIVGNGNWPKSSILATPGLEGALVATPDFGNEKLISASYRSAYGIVPSAASLYAYDLVAIVAGINRAKGPEGLTDGTIRSKAGFKGVTGAFRFRDDGSVERLFEIQQLRGGRLVAAAGSQPGF